MHRRLPALPASRVAAALLAVVLSGAPGLVPRTAAAEQRCPCRATSGGHHQCACPLCRLAALRAAARDPSAPPCHRAAAREALSRELARPENGGAPCCSSRCDAPGGAPGADPSPEPFTLPRLPALAHGGQELGHLERASAPAHRAPLPELPPPRSRPS